MQVAGIIPKTERKPKNPPANKVDNSNGFHNAEKLPSPSLSNGNGKKDPGAVFKFEEDSSDVHDVFPYKNGLVGTLNGKGKSCKSRDSTSYNVSKDMKNVKTQYGTTKNSTPNFTTKKITDKNKNVYTAVVATTGSCVNSNSGNKVSNSKSKTTCWSNAAASVGDANSIASVVTSKSSNTVTKVHSSELNILHDSEDIRQFEQLKTLKQLDKSLLSSEINPKDGSGGEDAKSQVFPRLTLPGKKSNAASERKSEIASTSPPPPPLISRSNNSIIIKTESQIAPLVKLEIKKENEDDGNKPVNIEKQPTTNHSDHILLSPSGSNDSSNQSSIGSNDHCSSIDKDLKNRHEFLAHVRHSFKSQYKSLRKACKFSEKYEQNGKQKLRDSLVRCVRIDSSICAQVLLGYGLKFPPSYTPIKIEVETKTENGRKPEYDDYDFVDNESATPINKINSTSEQKSKKGKGSNSSGGKTNKSSSSSKPTNPRSGKKGKDVEEDSNSNPGQSDGGEKKGRGKGQQDVVTRESKSKSSSATLACKRKLKRSDAISVSSESSLGSGGERLNENGVVSLNNNNADSSDGIKKKKQKMDLNEMSALESELGLSLNDQSSPDERIASSAHHQTLTQGSGVHAISDVHHELHDILENSQLSSSVSSHRNQGLETVLNSVGSSENAGTPDGVITDASFDSTFEHSTSSQPGIKI